MSNVSHRTARLIARAEQGRVVHGGPQWGSAVGVSGPLSGSSGS